jgi:hypothetical protein
MVLEMVWVRSRMGDNKSALYLIIDRLGDVNRVRLVHIDALSCTHSNVGHRLCKREER